MHKGESPPAQAQEVVRSPLRLGILVSGGGTNLQAIVDAIGRGELHAEVTLVVCNHKGAQAVERAERAGVPVEVYERRDFPSRLAKQRLITRRLEEAGVELVVCAGWDRVLEGEILAHFAGRIINVHPSLLPAFGGGLHAIKDAWEYGVKVAGCTVHFVTEEVDAGPIISQAAVPILPHDTMETLTKKIHIEEHRLLIEAIQLYEQGYLEIKGRKVRIKSKE